LKQRAVTALGVAIEERDAAGFIISHDPFTLALLCDEVVVLGRKTARIAFGSPHPRSVGDLASGADAHAFAALSEAMFVGPSGRPTSPGQAHGPSGVTPPNPARSRGRGRGPPPISG
jgi:hypothetical protein